MYKTKIKFTKNELRRQKEALGRFIRFLPVLQLKKQQLQFEIARIDQRIEEKEREIEAIYHRLEPWIDVFAEEVDIEQFLDIKDVNIEKGNIAGIDISVFKEVIFEEKEYDYMVTPLWIDEAIEACKTIMSLEVELSVLREQRQVLAEELRITTQRVNLFEKVKIPETKENIRRINIYLGDLQTAEVVRGKIAKAKIYQARNQ